MVKPDRAAGKGHPSKELTAKEILCSPVGNVLGRLKSSESGLTANEAGRRLGVYGHNEVARRKEMAAVVEFLLHFKNPLILILLAAGAISAVLGNVTDPLIIFAMILLSVVLDYYQEHRAGKAAEKLLERIATTATVMRDGVKQEVRLSDVVPGDVVYLSAGDIIPADARLVSFRDLFVDQSALTGESFPVEKLAVRLKPAEISAVTSWTNYLFMGTSVVSGSATALVVKTGSATEYGEIVKRAVEMRPETEFERGMKKFGYLITQVILVLALFAFLANALYMRGVLESLLFAVALAVGLTPELLPMIISVNLSNGAVAMSKKGVIVKRLESIQNFGSMDVLCTDKTGTLTEGKVSLVSHVDTDGKNSEKVLLYACLNSVYQTGIRSPFDEAILKHEKAAVKGWHKVDEIPFDFERRRVSVVVRHGNETLMMVKGSPEGVCDACSHYERAGKVSEISDAARRKFKDAYLDMSAHGYRVLGVAYKRVSRKAAYSVEDESGMALLGFVAFMDPPKGTAKDSLQTLKRSNIELKIVTGDNDVVTRKVCEELGFDVKRVVLGSEMVNMTEDALDRVVEEANIFARVTPIQKDRIIAALKRNGHVVGFLGDGINDASSMRLADVGISVENAVDVAKESADIILLHKDLRVLHEGVLDGRKTFANTMKYIMLGLSSNFGNMFSVAIGSLFLPFLPMLPTQILLNNFLYDLSQSTLPTDNVDQEYVQKPKKLDIRFIRDFMIFFGPISSLFDLLTYAVMLLVFHATAPIFQAAWFIESLSTQTLVIYMIRTRKPFFKSRPSALLVLSGLGVVGFGLLLPLTVLGPIFKFEPLPGAFYIILAAMVVTYLFMVEVLKGWFYKRHPL